MNSTNLAGNSFSWVLQTSWQAAVLVLLVLIVQMIFRHKLSPAWRYGLWLLVVVRLLMPASPQTAWSIFNVAKLPVPLALVESASLPRTSGQPMPSAEEMPSGTTKPRRGVRYASESAPEDRTAARHSERESRKDDNSGLAPGRAAGVVAWLLLLCDAAPLVEPAVLAANCRRASRHE